MSQQCCNALLSQKSSLRIVSCNITLKVDSKELTSVIWMGGGYMVCVIHIHGTRASSVEVHVLGGRGEKLNDLVSEQPGIPSH